MSAKFIPVNEAEFVNCFYRQCDFCHVESSDVFCEDLILDQHRHQVATWEEFHEHVEEGRILECRVQLHNPRTVRLCQNISFRADMS